MSSVQNVRTICQHLKPGGTKELRELLSRQQAVKGLTVSPGWDRLATQACGQIKWRQATTRHPSGLQVGLELSLRALWRTQERVTSKAPLQV